MDAFHPIISGWFGQRFRGPTDAQARGWPEILAGRNTLIAAPTGSGKTLAAFLVCIDRLFRQGLGGSLADETQVVYISPLKALSNDVRRNLELPLSQIGAAAAAAGIDPPEIRVQVRTGDTPASERGAMIRRPPHILVTTPESLYLLLTAERSRQALRRVQTVIVDEIHALARDKRGSHLALSLQRLDAVCESAPVRIGLSATQRPVDEIARFLVGTARVAESGEPQCSVIDVGHIRERDVAVEVPPSELAAVCSNEQWLEIYQRLVALIQAHRSTLVFVNTRRLAERVAHNLRELLGQDSVASHHGSLSRDIRLAAEERLKAGQLKALVATASLELGIDVGFIELVCQIGSPRSIATFLQRVGRSGHALGVVPKGRIFPLTRDELIESLTLVRSVRHGLLDCVEIPRAPLDILAQQIVAETAAAAWDEDKLFETFRGAWPYRGLQRGDFDAIVEMLSEGVTRAWRRTTYLHRDAIHRQVRARRGARLVAMTSGGAIPEMADYRVVTEADQTLVGTVNEDFAIESMAGEIFLLGNTSWRIRQVRAGEVVVQDAHGAPATIPFWLGEAPARTRELSAELSRLREEVEGRLTRQTARHSPAGGQNGERDACDGSAATAPDRWADAIAWLKQECGCDDWAARQAATYVAAQHAALGLVPTQQRIVFERFFDESGGMQLVIHAPVGGRINRAWGLALRKRFCRSFDFELQAAATENGIVLSLGPQHSFPIEQMFRMLTAQNAAHLLTQALLAAPMFGTRWRWNATRALAILRQNGGKKVPPPLQRMRADDLLAAVFPAQTGCFENHAGDTPIPDHPLVRQTVHDCLHEAMDLDGWLDLLRAIASGQVQLLARDTREPSPFSHEILNANPYAFLDPAPLEERRARAVVLRRSLSIESVQDLGRLDPAAIARVRQEAWPTVRDGDELHDTLLALVALPAAEAGDWSAWFEPLVRAGRAMRVERPGRPELWAAAESWPLLRAAFPEASAVPAVSLPEALAQPRSAADAWVAMVRGRLDCAGPVTATAIGDALGLERSAVQAALEALEGEGFALRGRFTAESHAEQSPPAAGDSRETSNAAPGPREPNGPNREIEWCERRLLARIHRLTLDGLRRRIQPVEPVDFIRFLVEHQHIAPHKQVEGEEGVRAIVGQLQGFELPAGAWEYEVLPSRVREYDPAWLDGLTLCGQVTWGRLRPPQREPDEPPSGTGISRVVPISLALRAELAWLLPGERGSAEVSARCDARLVYDTLAARGALFFDDLRAATGLLAAQLEDALAELAALGAVTADGFAAIRPLVSGDRRRVEVQQRRRRRGAARFQGRTYARGGRWALFPGPGSAVSESDRAERWAEQLLRRYGVVFRDLLTREVVAPPWRLLVPVYRRLEARGEIRGGRFVMGVAGEQFATPEAVERLRQIRDEKPSRDWLVISAADPANLAGIVTAGPRIAATRSNRLVLQAGRLIASYESGDIQFHEAVEPALADRVSRSLRRDGLYRAEVELLCAGTE